MESESFTLVGIFPPNPVAKRATRVKWSLKPQAGEQQIVAYGAQKNLVVRKLAEPLKSFVYNTQVLSEITCVKYSHNGYHVAIGDEKGGVKVLGWSAAENNFTVKYQNDGVLGGAAVNDIAFSDDN